MSGHDQVRAEGLHHLLLECSDLKKSVSFYTEVLGIGIRGYDTHRDGRPLVLTDAGLGLTEGRSDNIGIDHFAFRSSGVDELARRAEDAGVVIARGPGPGPYGHTVYLIDPDGTEVELFE